MTNTSNLSEDELQEIREIFGHFDKDGNGTIDAGEFAALIEALDSGMEPDQVAMGLSIVDADGNGTVEFDEFLSWWTDAGRR